MYHFNCVFRSGILCVALTACRMQEWHSFAMQHVRLVALQVHSAFEHAPISVAGYGRQEEQKDFLIYQPRSQGLLQDLDRAR